MIKKRLITYLKTEVLKSPNDTIITGGEQIQEINVKIG